jgi:hypothetical protein
MGSGQGWRPVKYAHWHVTFMALLKHILKMAQLLPLCSRWGMLAGSFSIVVGVTEGGGVSTELILVSCSESELAVEIAAEVIAEASAELEGVFWVVLS